MSEVGEQVRDGRLVGSRYRLLERIGSGGMGTVWRAFDELVDREVAVKQPRLPGDPEDEEFQRAAHRLYREARAAARVDHPSAVTIHDVVIEDELPWIVMELVRGESLHALLARGPVAPAEAARIGRAVLGALCAAHSVGIVHRDVKPANVLLGPHDRVVLTDFGIAHIQGEESLTASGEFVGSLEFIAPERMSGTVAGAGPASDLWSLGVLLYAVVEGASPFRRTTVESTLGAILAADPPEPTRAGPLGPLILRMLAREPEARPAAEEVGAVLDAVAEGKDVPDRPVPTVPSDAVPDAVPEDLPEEMREEKSEGAPEAAVVEAPDAAAVVAEPATGPAPDLEAAPDLEPTPDLEAAPDLEPTPDLEAAPDLEPTPDLEAAPDPESAPDPDAESISTPKSRSQRPRWVRPLLLVLGALLLTGLVLGTVVDNLLETADSESSRPWTAHPERKMSAVLYLPSPYKRVAAQTESGTRVVTYATTATGVLRVRLTERAGTSSSPLTEAHALTRGTSNPQYTRTSFRGNKDAVLADTVQDGSGVPTRVMALIIRTADGRMYELRVDMPKGTPDEKEGTALFKGARDRLTLAGK
ncbi:protein kinase [Streptomyces sp. NPDC096013]|uniref:protein kinase domain-containing protein n=1 Tax=Streptomyces sp. NPDC096013 TaxID=3366069 RepID=UPI003807FC38